MSIQTVVDAWVTDLAAVSGLTTAIQHKYASWSAEQLHAELDERHLAMWPDGDALESREPLTTEPADTVATSFTVLIWEDAASESTRLYDDDTLNQAWLALYEAVLARFYVRASVAGSTALGGAGLRHQFTGSRMGMVGTVRFMEVAMTTSRGVPYA
jgi:hypothetical protein